MILALLLAATYAAPPETYSMTKKSSDDTVRIARDGQKLALDMSSPKSAHQPVATHTRMVIDLATMRAHTWDLNDAKSPCSEQDGKGFDPFDDSWLKEWGEPKQTGHEKVRGMDATVYEASSPDGTARWWRDDKYGLVLKVIATPKGQKPFTMMEVTQFSLTRPNAAYLEVPARCSQPPQPVEIK
jgi:hypothetical protein